MNTQLVKFSMDDHEDILINDIKAYINLKDRRIYLEIPYRIFENNLEMYTKIYKSNIKELQIINNAESLEQNFVDCKIIGDGSTIKGTEKFVNIIISFKTIYEKVIY